MKKKSLMSYFIIPIIMVVVVLAIMLSLALFSPKTYVLKIYSFDGQDSVATYRAPQGGKELYTYVERVARQGYIFDGYYFQRGEQDDGNGNITYTFDEAYKVPEDYKIEENITLYVKWVPGPVDQNSTT